MTISQPDRLDQFETTMSGILNRLETIDKKLEKLDTIDRRLDGLDTQVGEVKDMLKTLDNRFFDFSMRVLTVNSSAYWAVAIAFLSAAITFAVTRVTRGPQ